MGKTPHDIRWKQRLSNFEKSLNLLEQALKNEEPDIFHRAAIIQFFEMSIELAWKTLKDYLEDQGFSDVSTPRNAIKKSFETGIINHGHRWMNALEDRNQTVHAYDEEKAMEVESLIRNNYFPPFKRIAQQFKRKIP